ncbi:MAG: DUF1566 domain-containing protein [Bacteroidales bacterium]|nr:DUF1566 domain-containing protein [Bacteroidales bacterium]
MKKTLLILSAIVLFFAGCKKDTLFEEGEVLYSGSINGYKYIDLGLPSGLKWATCNVGASSPEDYGDYFALGETETKSEYTESNSLTYGLTISELQSQGYIDGSGNLTPSHDAATANWGGSWRMPTKAELEELIDECTWTWTAQGGKKGHKVTGPNGNSIFLPAAGHRVGSSFYNAGEDGFYWSSTPYESGSIYAYFLHFLSDNQYVGCVNRDNGYTVRPVSGVQLPTVTTNDVTNITSSSATCGGNVTFDGGFDITARGVCWSTNPNPTINDNKTSDGNGTGSFTSSITGLTANITYYVRAYATNEKGTSYGEQRSFTTLDPPTINGHEYVDLGLPSGLKWATCNVGASSPEDYGDYFAWGETETKSEYTESNSLTYGLTISELQSQGYIDGSGNLTPSHDAATANWGGSWRMPTKVELEELYNECTWTWKTQNGVKGYKVTGPNGNHIFLPAAGWRRGTSLYSDGGNGSYWSSTPGDDYDGAYGLSFGGGFDSVSTCFRDGGETVRPVSE